MTHPLSVPSTNPLINPLFPLIPLMNSNLCPNMICPLK